MELIVRLSRRYTASERRASEQTILRVKGALLLSRRYWVKGVRWSVMNVYTQLVSFCPTTSCESRGVGSVHRSAGARRCLGPLVGRHEALARSVSRSALARSVSQSVQSRGSVHQSVGNVRLRIYRSLDGRATPGSSAHNESNEKT